MAAERLKMPPNKAFEKTPRRSATEAWRTRDVASASHEVHNALTGGDTCRPGPTAEGDTWAGNGSAGSRSHG